MKSLFALALLAIVTQPAQAEVQKQQWYGNWGWPWAWGRGYWPYNTWWWKKRNLRAQGNDQGEAAQLN